MSTTRLLERTPNPDVYLEAMSRNTGLPTQAIYSCLNQPYFAEYRDSRPGSDDYKGLLEIIQQACRDLGYIPANPLWRAKLYPDKAGLTFCIANSIRKSIENPYFGKMIQAMTEAAREQGIHVTYADFYKDVDYSPKETQLPREILTSLSNKFVIAGRTNTSLVERLIRAGGIVVSLSRASDVPGTVSVVPDYRGAAKQAIQMLYAHGHRSIAIAGANYFKDKGYNFNELTAGAMETASGLDISLTGEDIFIAEDSHIGDRPDFISSIRDSTRRYTAVFCLDDAVGAALFSAASLINLSIPEDLSLVGCNDQGNSDYSYPELSTIHVPLKRMGKLAFEEATRLVREGRPETARIVKMATSPTLRESIRFV